jgi:Cd2+/Zn2+-exporting ATPase
VNAQLKQVRYRVEGMDCAACATKIDTAARRVAGISDVSVSVTAGTMILTHSDEADLQAVERKVVDLGYGIAKVSAGALLKPSGYHEGHDHADHGHEEQAAPIEGSWWKGRKARLTIASGAALAVAYAVATVVPAAQPWVYILAMAIGLVPIARRAFSAAMNGSPFSIETLMTIAAVGAVIIGASEEAATVVFLFLVGEMLEGVAAGRARASIKNLTTLVPKTALIEEGGKTREIAADQLAVRSIILVRPGGRIPADGVIVEGDSAIDEAPVTGESTPNRKTVDAEVFAGTVNLEGVLRVRVTAAATDNTIARIVRLVEEAQESKAPTERFIERFSRYYTPAVLVVGALVAVVPPLLFGGLWSTWAYRGLAVLLIGCPCALVISTPAAIAAALSAGARRGLLLKGGAVLEAAGKITTAAFDKTGTLTEGKPKVTDIIALGRNERDVLSLAASLEAGSSHPLAKAILMRASADKVPLPPVFGAQAISGKGIGGSVGGMPVFFGSPAEANARTPLSAELKAQIDVLNGEGKTVSILLVRDQLAGAIAMRDEPRADARAGIDALKRLGVSAVMLTGDNRNTAAAIAKTLGIEARAELLPEDKQRIVMELKAKGETVAKIGDGINDAPALAAADVGIAMGGGTDVALETADAAVLRGRVLDVADMVALSRAAMGNIKQNITIALGLKAVFLVTTIIGVTGLWPAILADTGATVLVTANAMRLLAWRGGRAAV